MAVSEQATTSAVCSPTRDARERLARALVALGTSEAEVMAKREGAIALGGIAAGCAELQD